MIKVMLDANIFISAALFPKGKVAQALIKAIQPPFQPYVCDYVIDDLHRKFYEKFPDKITALDAFLFNALEVIKRVRTPAKEESDEKKIRDTKDRPILRAATTVFFLTRVVAFFRFLSKIGVISNLEISR